MSTFLEPDPPRGRCPRRSASGRDQTDKHRGDDDYADFHTEALPILDRYGFAATVGGGGAGLAMAL
jgi:hypothetical protein